jgi:hypothetical protein
MLANLRAVPTAPASLSVYVSYDNNVMFGTRMVPFPTAGGAGEVSPAFVPPIYGSVWALLYLTGAAVLEITYGDLSIDSPEKPECPENCLPICFVYVNTGVTYISWSDLYDCRPIFSIGGEIPDPVDPVPVAVNYDHLHIFMEDHTAECNDSKDSFLTAFQFEEDTLKVYLDGSLVRGVDPFAPRDGFSMPFTPSSTNTLLVEYLAVLLPGGSSE